MGCFIGLIGESDSTWDKALKKAEDPHMTLDGNPLRQAGDPQKLIRRKNMERLENDASMWNDPKRGEAYRAIRSMVYRKGE